MVLLCRAVTAWGFGRHRRQRAKLRAHDATPELQLLLSRDTQLPARTQGWQTICRGHRNVTNPIRDEDFSVSAEGKHLIQRFSGSALSGLNRIHIVDIVDPARMQGSYTLATYLTLPP